MNSETNRARLTVRLFVLFEGLTFVAASLTHYGVLLRGYEHLYAGKAESVIAAVLLAGWAFTWMRPGSTRVIGIVVQAFALFGTLVGIYTIYVGIGPRTLPDISYHACITIVLVIGLIAASRSRPTSPVQPPSYSPPTPHPR